MLTTSDPISFFTETLRRILATLISPPERELNQRIAELLPIFAPHANTLAGMSRPIEDWLIDTIIIPFDGILFSIVDAINALSQNFDFYNSSPKFNTDWRWYKDIHTEPFGYNELAVQNYQLNSHNFIDYRITSAPRELEKNLKLGNLCTQIYDLGQKFENTRETILLEEALEKLSLVIENIRTINPQSAEAYSEFLLAVKTFIASNVLPELPTFKYAFGRGMQYVSFIRSAD